MQEAYKAKLARKWGPEHDLLALQAAAAPVATTAEPAAATAGATAGDQELCDAGPPVDTAAVAQAPVATEAEQAAAPVTADELARGEEMLDAVAPLDTTGDAVDTVDMTMD